MSLLKKLYYALKPGIPRKFQVSIHKNYNSFRKPYYKHVWPIDAEAGIMPSKWKGWPDDKQFALILTHDVELFTGQEKCLDVAKMEIEYGLCSSFNFVPERYKKLDHVHQFLRDNDFEIGIHGLKHDGKLYSSEEVFKERAIHINQYLKKWNAVGFRSPAMHHNLDWIHYLNIDYDASTFDTDPFEPQPDGVKTIFPFWVNGQDNRGYVELPYTLPQDSTLFIFMNEKNIDIWKRKLDWIADKGGMALLNTHPDYMNFSGKKLKLEEYPSDFYRKFLEYVVSKYKNQFWHALPKEITKYFKSTLK